VVISRISRGYWIWGQFDIKSTKLLSSLYQTVNKELNGPKFDVHLTISGPFPYKEDTHTKIFENLTNKFGKFNLQLNGIKHSSQFFQSLFIDIIKNKNLNNLKDSVDQSFNKHQIEYHPHISLFYGIVDDVTKKEIIRNLKTPKNVILDRLSIAKVDEENKSWKIVKSYSLF
tara:strand:+ start:266 stop:781 length:516 start_codon:yes stop_codon:yes gene_type:complete